MKTEVLMERKLMGMVVHQKSKSEYLSITDLVKAGNAWRAAKGMPLFNEKKWLVTSKTKEFICELESQTGETVKISARGRGQHTWAHPYLFIDMALAINPKLKVDAYKWLYDSLLKYRNESGDSYRRMSGTVVNRIDNKSTYVKKQIEIAKKIQVACGVSDWQSASESKLVMRDNIHRSIELYGDVMTNVDEIVRLAISKYQKEIENE